MSVNRGFNINMVGNLNKPVTTGQKDFFRNKTGYDMPTQVTTFGGASRAIDCMKQHAATGQSYAQMILEKDCYATKWDNSSRTAVDWDPIWASNIPLSSITMVPQTAQAPTPAPAATSAPAQPTPQGGATKSTTINVPGHSGVTEAPKVEVVKVPEEEAKPKPKAKKGPAKWRLIATESVQGFSAHPDIEKLVPLTGPGGKPMLDGKEVNLVVRECDYEYWYALKKFKRVGAVGPTGTGKDISAIAFAHANKLPYKVFPFCGTARVEDLWGNRDLKAVNGVTESPFVHHDDLKILRYGGLLVLSEVNGGNTNDLIALNQTLEAREATVAKTGETFRFHEHAYVTFNLNPGYEGTKALNPAFKGRFKSIVFFPAWTKSELNQLMGNVSEFDRLAELYSTMQKAMGEKNGLRGGTISIRNLLTIQSMLEDDKSLDEALHEGLLNAFRCDTKERANYEAAFGLTQKIFGTEVKMRKD